VSGGHPPLTTHRRLGPGAVLRAGASADYHAIAITDGEPHVVRGPIGMPGCPPRHGAGHPLLCRQARMRARCDGMATARVAGSGRRGTALAGQLARAGPAVQAAARWRMAASSNSLRSAPSVSSHCS
jgi:hypothetical protein